MNNLVSASRASLTNSEIRRLQQRVDQKNARASRSQYLGNIFTVDAEQGFTTMALASGGMVNVVSITNSVLGGQSAISLPRNSTLGQADAKPV